MEDAHQYCGSLSRNDYYKTKKAIDMWKVVQSNGHPIYLTTNPILITDLMTDNNV
jgi:hypothetical protein